MDNYTVIILWIHFKIMWCNNRVFSFNPLLCNSFQWIVAQNVTAKVKDWIITYDLYSTRNGIVIWSKNGTLMYKNILIFWSNGQFVYPRKSLWIDKSFNKKIIPNDFQLLLSLLVSINNTINPSNSERKRARWNSEICSFITAGYFISSYAFYETSDFPLLPEISIQKGR